MFTNTCSGSSPQMGQIGLIMCWCTCTWIVRQHYLRVWWLQIRGPLGTVQGPTRPRVSALDMVGLGFNRGITLLGRGDAG